METQDQPVFSRAGVETFPIPGRPRSYDIAPLSVRERAAAKADVVGEAGLYPTQEQLYAALRDALRDAAPANLDELLTIVDEAEQNPTDVALVARVSPVENACMSAPSYRALLAQRTRYMEAVPLIYARHALRGWDGEKLPPFRREKGLVPFDLLDVLPDDELRAIGMRAFALSQPNQAAEKNSAAPSRSSGTPMGTQARSSRSAGAATSLRAKKLKRTRG
jgi:hypothetical protein